MRSAFALVFSGAQISQAYGRGSCGTFMAMLRNYGIGFVSVIIWKGGGGALRPSCVMGAILFCRPLMRWSIGMSDTILVFNLARCVCVCRSYLKTWELPFINRTYYKQQSEPCQ
jgi:hypothetical protein